MQPKSLIIFLLPLLALAVGWFLVLIGFGRFHQLTVVDNEIFRDVETYRVFFLQYWTFILITPVAMILVVLYALTDNVGLGVFARVLLCAAAVGLGGCLANSSQLVEFEFRFEDARSFIIVALVGEVISLLAFLVLFGIISATSWILKQVGFSEDS